MKKRISALFVALLIALSCVTFIGAANVPSFVIDETETLSQEDIDALNEIANEYYEKYDTEISYALFEGNDSEEIADEAENLEPATDAENRSFSGSRKNFSVSPSNTAGRSSRKNGRTANRQHRLMSATSPVSRLTSSQSPFWIFFIQYIYLFMVCKYLIIWAYHYLPPTYYKYI